MTSPGIDRLPGSAVDGRIVEPPGTGDAVNVAPDSSAVRTALWRALHVQLDAPPRLIADEIGLALAAPDEGWRDRPDMHPIGTRPYRMGIVARTGYPTGCA